MRASFEVYGYECRERKGVGVCLARSIILFSNFEFGSAPAFEITNSLSWIEMTQDQIEY